MRVTFLVSQFGMTVDQGEKVKSPSWEETSVSLQITEKSEAEETMTGQSKGKYQGRDGENQHMRRRPGECS